MKKSLLALAVAAVAASSVASAATVYDKDGTSLAVYGRMQAVVYSGHAANKIGNSYQDTGLQGSGRLGFDMRTQLTDGIAAFAKAEWDVADNNDRTNAKNKSENDTFDARYLWVGVDFGQFGQVKFGRFEDAVKYVLLPTDVGYADDFDCLGQMDNDDKRDGNIMYTWNGYGFTVNANYQTAKDSQQVDGAWYPDASGAYGERKLDIDNAYGISVGYQSPDVLFRPIGVRLGYAAANFQDESNTPMYTAAYDKYNQYAASIYWGNLNAASGPFIAAMYQVRDFSMRNTSDINDYKVQGAEFVVGYGFECGVSAIVGYNWMNIDEDGADGVDVDASVIPVAVNYQITPNFQVWAEARFDAGTDDDAQDANGVIRNFDEIAGTYNTENVYSLGARYTF